MVSQKPTAVLGISAFYHDSAAALVVDGEIVAAAQEERFTRKKHDHAFPTNAIDYCLDEAGLDAGGPRLRRLLRQAVPEVRAAARDLPRLRAGAASARSSRRCRCGCGRSCTCRARSAAGSTASYRRGIVFTEHHESHAARAFFPSPFEEAAILTLDGVGEWATASFGVGRGNRIELTHELHFPHSLGLLYSAFTYFSGFRVNSGEYKLMGLAPYGEPRYADLILDKLLDLKDDGSFRLDLELLQLLPGPDDDLAASSTGSSAARRGTPESPLTQREMDLAASIQKVTEEIVLRTARHVHAQTGMKNLCLAGGVALNCVGNGRILREGPFETIWIQPAAGDAGGALGAALFIWHQLLGNAAAGRGSPTARRARCSGRSFSSDEIRAFLDGTGAVYRHFDDEDELDARDRRPDRRREGRRLVPGPDGVRAAGARLPQHPRRRPQPRDAVGDEPEDQVPRVVPALRADRAARARQRVLRDATTRPTAPTCCWCADVAEDKRLPASRTTARSGSTSSRSSARRCPAITHVDYSARVQTVDPERHPRLHRLMTRFDERTGCPVMINTSFNVRGEPIVCTPGGRLPLLHGHQHGRAGARELRAAEGGATGRAARRIATRTWRSSSWTEGQQMSVVQINTQPDPPRAQPVRLHLAWLPGAVFGVIACFKFGSPAGRPLVCGSRRWWCRSSAGWCRRSCGWSSSACRIWPGRSASSFRTSCWRWSTIWC